MRAAAPVSLLLLTAACSHQLQSSALITGRELPPSTAPVEISATRDPLRAEALGVVEAHGSIPVATLEGLVTAFRTRVASMGGDYGRIDDLATRHEMVTEQHDYECGSFETETEMQSVLQTEPDGSSTFVTQSVPVSRYVSKTCTEQVQVEAATLTLVGRAFRTARGTP
jgi:hypothetical protein